MAQEQSFFKPYIYTLASSFTHFTLISCVRPYISLLASQNGADSLMVGLIAALHSLVQVALALPVAAFINRFGSRVALLWGSSIYIAISGGLMLSRSMWAIMLLSMMMGSAHCLVISSMQFEVTRQDLGIDRHKLVGYYAFFNSLGISCGSYLGGWLNDLYGSNLGFSGGLAMAVLTMLLILKIKPGQKSPAAADHGKLGELLRAKNVLPVVLISGVNLFCMEVITIYLPLHGSELGLSAKEIGMVLGFSGLAQMVIRPFLKSLTDRFTLARTLLLCLFVGGLGLAAFGFFDSLAPLIAVAIVGGLALGLLNPITMLAIADTVTPDKRTTAFALRSILNYSGQAASPLFFGLLATSLGLAPVFWISGASMLACMALARKSKF